MNVSMPILQGLLRGHGPGILDCKTSRTNHGLMQVLRWGALVFGVFYGFSHQSAINSSDKKIAAQQEWDKKERLIQRAKAEYVKTSKPKTDDGGKF